MIQYLLDTSVLVVTARGGELGTAIERRFRLTETPLRPLICVISVGEVYKFARQRNWGHPKRQALDELLRNLVVVDIRPQPVLDAYAEIAWYSEQQRGRTISQNDYWIAAAAKVTGATLLTTDRDFDHLDGVHIRREWIDPAQR